MRFGKCPAIAESNKRRSVHHTRRFVNAINKNGPIHPLYGRCWLWKSKNDYGSIAIERGKTVRIHRYSYEFYIGPIPNGMLVCHKCDNPKCINPNHLFLGTDGDNSDDKVSKNRQTRLKGEENGMAVLADDAVREMRKNYRKGSRLYGTGAYARKYGVSDVTIMYAIQGKTWKHVK